MKRTVEIVQINPGLNIVGQPHVITVHKGVASVLTFRGIGGQVGKYVFALLAGFGTVPTGMAFADNGDGTASISGTPTAYGDFPITMTLDNNGRAIKKSFIIRVPALTLQLVQTSPIYAGVSYPAGTVKLVAKGGSGSGYVYSLATHPAIVDSVTGYITAGALPQGTYTDTATVVDSASNTVSVPVGLIVLPRLTAVAAAPPTGEVGCAYSYQFKVAGATGAVTWSETGSLPTGVSLNATTGILSGTPTVAPQSRTFIVTATDAGTGDHLDMTVTVATVARTTVIFDNLTIYPGLGTFLPPCVIGHPYSATVHVTGGVAPYRFYDNNGELTGLGFSVDPNTGTVTGTVNGMPITGAGFDNGILVEVDAVDALGNTGFTAQAGLAFTFSQHTMQVRQSGIDVGAAGPVVLDFVGATVTDTGSGVRQIAFGTAAALASDTDGTLAANSDTRVATQKATKTYVDNAVTGLLDFKGATNCSGNPNYPAASKGDAYVVSTAGKIGGASGTAVDIGDVYCASADNAGGTQASVGSSWFVLEHNLVGALLTANNLSDVASAVAALDNITAQGADIASASTTNIATATGRNVNITGTTTITALGTAAAGVERVTRFTGALVLTHNATSMINVTAANITTAANDIAVWLSLGSGNWRMTDYTRADGTPLTGGAGSSPLTTKGDLFTHGTVDARLGVGADGQTIFGDSTQTLGLVWANGAMPVRYGLHDYDDLVYGLASNGLGGKISVNGVTGGGSISPGLIAGHPGAWQISSGSSINGASRACMAFSSGASGSTGMLTMGSGVFETIIIFQTDLVSTAPVRYLTVVGLCDSNTPISYTGNLIALVQSDNINGGAFVLDVVTAGTAVVTNGVTVPANNTWYALRLVTNAAYTQIDMYTRNLSTNAAEVHEVSVSGLVAGTTLPATSVGLGLIAEVLNQNNSASRTLNLDAMGYHYLLNGPR
jgi:hypothetical protein